VRTPASGPRPRPAGEYPLDPRYAKRIRFTVLIRQSVFLKQLLPAVALCAGAAFLMGLWAALPSTKQGSQSSTRARTSAASAREQWTGLSQSTIAAKPSVDLDALTRELIERGKAALAAGDFEAGFKAYRRAVEFNPNAETHGLIGDLYLRAAVPSEAAFHLRRAADLDPNNADRWLALANVYILQTDLGAAWKAIERAKQTEPDLIIDRDKNNFAVRGHAG
jgi:cytochrome c-type biogenesis protein CcmH/NrfG